MNDQRQKTDWAMTLGLVFTVIGGLVAIGIAVVISHSVSPLWALILLAWGVEQVRNTPRKGQYWKPTILGLLMGVMYVVLGVVAHYTGNIGVLWAMILVGWVGEAII